MGANLENHPCYNREAQYKYARLHLAVAPYCNIQCNYCNRLYDCVNESRPGVTGEVLDPREALAKVGTVLAKVSNLAVVAIAGPGEPLANQETFESLELINQAYPQLTLCLSTNGLLLPEKLPHLISTGVTALTITINCIDPTVGEQIYSSVRYHGRTYQGREGAELLIQNQWQGIEDAAKYDLKVKVNSVFIPDVNGHQISEVARAARQRGALMQNIMPLIPLRGTKFACWKAPTADELRELRDRCELELRQMRHCRQCRADAVGLLGHDRRGEFAKADMFQPVGTAPLAEAPIDDTLPLWQPQASEVIRVAVASRGTGVVDQHFGHAREFLIYDVTGDTERFLGLRSVDGYCHGSMYCGEKQEILARTISRLRDCQALVCSRIGPEARRELQRAGIQTVERYERIDLALKEVARQLGAVNPVASHGCEGGDGYANRGLRMETD